MTATEITLTGFVADPPEIAAAGDTVLEIRFQLVLSPTDDAVSDATVPCVLRDADCSRADAEDFFAPDALIRVTGLLHLPERPGGGIVLEVTDVDEDDHVDPRLPDLADIEPQIPVSAHVVAGRCLLECVTSDGSPVWHLIADSGEAVTGTDPSFVYFAFRNLTD